jgi:hypothetical protein
MEITAMQMVTTMKLITFAWNVEDGRNYVEPGSNEDKSGSAPATMSQVDPALAATRLPPSRIPTLLPFLGYVLFFPSLIGPASDYASYEALIDGSIFTSPPGTNEASRKASSVNAQREKVGKVDIPQPKSRGSDDQDQDPEIETLVQTLQPRSARPLIPKGRKSSAYRKLVTGLIMLGIYAVFGGQWSYGRIIDPELAKVGWWASKGIFGKWMYVMIAGFIARTKYYALWSISEVGPGHEICSRRIRIGRGTKNRYFYRPSSLSSCSRTGRVYSDRHRFQWVLDRFSRLGCAQGSVGQGREHQHLEDRDGSELQGLVRQLELSGQRELESGRPKDELLVPEMIADYVASARHRSILQVWLRDTMYKRLVKPGQKPGFAPTVMTFVTSAFWHGIGTGYYRELLKVYVSAGSVGVHAHDRHRTS